MSKGSIRHQVILWSQSRDVSQIMKLKKDDVIVRLVSASTLAQYRQKVKQHENNVIKNKGNQVRQALVIITPKTAKQALTQRRTQYLFFKYFYLGKIDNYDGGKPQQIEKLKQQLLFARRNQSELVTALLQVSTSLVTMGKQSPYYKCNFNSFDQKSSDQSIRKFVGYTKEEISQSVQYLTQNVEVKQSVAKILKKTHPNQTVSLVHNMSKSNLTSLHDTSMNTQTNVLSASILADVRDKHEKSNEIVSTSNILANIEKQQTHEIKSPSLKKIQSKFHSPFSVIQQAKKEEQIEVSAHHPQNYLSKSSINENEKYQQASKIQFQKKNKLNISIEINQIISDNVHDKSVLQLQQKKQQNIEGLQSKKISIQTESTKDEKYLQQSQKQFGNSKLINVVVHHDEVISSSEFANKKINNNGVSGQQFKQVEQKQQQKHKQIQENTNIMCNQQSNFQFAIEENNPVVYKRSRPRQSKKKFDYKKFAKKPTNLSNKGQIYINNMEIISVQQNLQLIIQSIKSEIKPLEEKKDEDMTYDRLQIIWVDPNSNLMLIQAIREHFQKQNLNIPLRQLQQFDFNQCENVFLNSKTQYLAITSNATFSQFMTNKSYPFNNINYYFVYCMRLENAFNNMRKYNPSNPVFITNESDQIVNEVCARAREEYNKIHGAVKV